MKGKVLGIERTRKTEERYLEDIKKRMLISEYSDMKEAALVKREWFRLQFV